MTPSGHQLRHRGSLSRAWMAGTFAGVVLLAGGCANNRIDADTPCRDYLQAAQSVREQAVQRIAVELEVSGAGSPFLVLNVDSQCGNRLDTPVGEIVARQQY